MSGAKYTVAGSHLLLFRVALSNIKMTQRFVALSPFVGVCLCKGFCQNTAKKDECG